MFFTTSEFLPYLYRIYLYINVNVIQILSKYSFNCHLVLKIKDQDDTTQGIRHSADHFTIKKLVYNTDNGVIENTTPLRIYKDRNDVGLHTYEDIAEVIVEVINSIRQYAK